MDEVSSLALWSHIPDEIPRSKPAYSTDTSFWHGAHPGVLFLPRLITILRCYPWSILRILHFSVKRTTGLWYVGLVPHVRKRRHEYWAQSR
jgi:hypothetical protein